MAYDLISGQTFLGAYDLVGAVPTPYQVARAPYGGSPYAGAPGAGLQQLALQRQAAYAEQGNQQAYMQAALAAKQAQAGALLTQMNPTKARKQVLGMVSNGTIAAAGVATITARPQTFAFRPERVFIPATIGPDFTIQDIKVGNVSQLVQSGDLPAEAFSQTAFGVEMDMDTVQTSQDFIIQVTNISGGARTFRAMILGRSANG